MTWYAVSAVLVFRFKEGDQNIWHVWEDVYLVSAPQKRPRRRQPCWRSSRKARTTESDLQALVAGKPVVLNYIE